MSTRDGFPSLMGRGMSFPSERIVKVSTPGVNDPRSMVRKHPSRVLILASYCDGEDDDCNETAPCIECLRMCNSGTITDTGDLLDVKSDNLVERAMRDAE